MSAMKTVSLTCDARPDDKPCWNRVDTWRSTVTDGRKEAEREGWTYDRASRKDYCPEHAVSVARGTVTG